MSAYGFGGMIKKLKANPKTIVFTEGTDARILEAASRLLASNFLTPILIGNEDEIINAAEEEGYNIRGAQIIDPLKYDRFDEMVDLFCELRKSKGMTPEKARPILSQSSCSADHQDETRQQHRIFLLHSGPCSGYRRKRSYRNG